uniref:UBX domain-containing protein n=1 Tax=Parastrongyloides trichosuri TaxID=131310 RepID=A0A0N4ZZ72_PARTI
MVLPQNMAQEHFLSRNNRNNSNHNGQNGNQPSVISFASSSIHEGNPYFLSSLDQIRHEATAAKRWLIVCVKEHSSPLSIHLNKLLQDSTVKHVITNNYFFVSYYTIDEEGQRLKMFYKLHQFPSLLILDPRTGEEVANIPNNIVDPSSFCDFLLNFIDRYTNFLAKDDEYRRSYGSLISPSQPSRQSMESNCKKRKLLTEDDDYNNSFIASSSKKTKTENLNGVDSIVVNGNKLTTIDKDEYKKFAGHPGINVSLLNISIQFPDGKRFNIQLYDNATMKALFLFIGGQGYNFREFNIIFGYPKRIIDFTEADKTLKVMGFQRRELIYIDKRC